MLKVNENRRRLVNVMVDNYKKLKTKLHVAFLYEFYIECIILEFEMINLLFDQLNLKWDDSDKFQDKLKKLLYLKKTNQWIDLYIKKQFIEEISKWYSNIKDCFMDFEMNIYNKKYFANVGNNIIKQLENNIVLIKKSYKNETSKVLIMVKF